MTLVRRSFCLKGFLGEGDVAPQIFPGHPRFLRLDTRLSSLSASSSHSFFRNRLFSPSVSSTSSSESSSTRSSSSSSSSFSPLSCVVDDRGQSRPFLACQSRSSSHSNWETTTSLVQTLKELTDDELSDRLDRLERINAKMRRILKWKRSVFRPESDASRRAYVVNEDGARTVALLVTYLGWDLPAFASAHPGVTTVQDAIINACYESGLAAVEDEERSQDRASTHKLHKRKDVESKRVDVGESAIKDLDTSFDIHDADGDDDNDNGEDYDAIGANINDDDARRSTVAPSTFESVDDRGSSLQFVGCGRTDVGVSGLHQVVTLRLKSARYADNGDEFSYVQALNHFLPPEMRILSWSLVPDEFSARFNCTQRSYAYFFPKGDLDLNLMRDAVSWLVGFHDFRNFCKIKKEVVWNIARYGNGVSAVSPFFKCIHSAEIVEKRTHSGLTICELRISANGFLWHQIRCIVSVLMLVGRKLESPDVVNRLLDVDALPEKPTYGFAAGFPLVLSGCEFLGLPSWRCDRDELLRLRDRFRNIAADLSAKSAIAGECAALNHEQLEAALKCELLGILKEREKQLSNPVGYDILRSIRQNEASTRDVERYRDTLNDLSAPYRILNDVDGDDYDTKQVRPYFLNSGSKATSQSKGKSRKSYTPLLARSRGPSLETRVQFSKDFVELVNKE